MAGKAVLDAREALAAAKADVFGKYGLEQTLPDTEIRAVSTGNVAIDYALGIGGLPLGRTIELLGPTGCGKTTTSLQTAAELQRIIRNGGDEARGISSDDAIIFLDYEHALDGNYATALGLDITDQATFIYLAPDDLEQGANAVMKLVESGLIRMVIIDSVALMRPRKELDAEAEEYSVGLHAKRMTEFLSRATPIFHKQNCMLILLNHQKEAIGFSRPGMPAVKTSTGGKGLKFIASVRIEYTPTTGTKGKIRNELTGIREDEEISKNTKIKVLKNKLAPTRTVIAQVRRGRGFDNFMTSIEVLAAQKRLDVGGAGNYTFPAELAHPDMRKSTTGIATIRGQEGVLAFADAHPEWRQQVIDAARTALFSLPDLAPDEDVDPDTGEIRQS